MKGSAFYGYGNAAPTKQKNKGKMQGPIDEHNLEHQYGEDDTWISGVGYKREGDLEKEMAADKRLTERINKKYPIPHKDAGSGDRFLRSERLGDLDERAGTIEQNELQDDDWYLGGAKKSDSDAVKKEAAKKGAKERKKLKKVVKTLDREQQIIRDRTNK